MNKSVRLSELGIGDKFSLPTSSSVVYKLTRISNLTVTAEEVSPIADSSSIHFNNKAWVIPIPEIEKTPQVQTNKKSLDTDWMIGMSLDDMLGQLDLADLIQATYQHFCVQLDSFENPLKLTPKEFYAFEAVKNIVSAMQLQTAQQALLEKSVRYYPAYQMSVVEFLQAVLNKEITDNDGYARTLSSYGSLGKETYTRSQVSSLPSDTTQVVWYPESS